ncbi:hypothetical protein BJX61DRAFT_498635 [Aspergillus egyptiacus]|nr:hypothetical protein BJX61DRAFT_498635 [Aspergillus egyptiacus]
MHRYTMDYPYPGFANDHTSFDVDMIPSPFMGPRSPYECFLSPSPIRSSPGRSRSPSVPSDYSGFLGISHNEPHCGRRRSTRNRRASQVVTPDVIDRLDTAARVFYHHEGPYDAVYPERNMDRRQSPIEALRESNAEALKATPRHKIADALNRHRPLDGVAYYPPGHTDNEGQTYEYEEGYNMMTDYGNFARFPGLKFTDEDFKNDPFYNSQPKAFGPIRNIFRRKNRVTT